ncbi:MAG: UDP-3-O-(3-hydroxymyristoyl)glucosamine N-acyltransferase [Desulfuromonadales bacterium]|nr:UDP-3-O-(3-hydroxymyristoyl)glucosamine N-acyltransferase [Desulfuromonadales bacterium]
MAKLRDLAALVEGRIVGDPETDILRMATIDQAQFGDITFLANPKYLPLLATTQASAVIIGIGVEAPAKLNLLQCDNPYLAFAKILNFLHVPRPEAQGVSPRASVDPSAEIAEGVTIHPGCVVGARVKIGAQTILYPNVVLYDDVTLGEDCIIHAGVIIREGCRIGHRVIVQPSAVIGSDGFGFAPDGERYYKIPQVGIVVIEDDVEVGACSCIDRAALGVTRLGEGVKLDNMVQIAHNVTIGAHTVIAAQTGISGSTKIGRHCTFGGQSSTAGHLKTGDNLIVAGRGALAGHTDGDQTVSGVPAIPHRDWLKASMIFAKLPSLRKEVSRMQREIDHLKNVIDKGE